MKPRERLNNYPEEQVLIHEAGHVVVGRARKLLEGPIQFLVDDPNEVARAWWQDTGATIEDKVVRSLAGIFIQAKAIPDSVDEILRNHLFNERITDGQLGSFGDLLGRNRSAGDWQKIREAFNQQNLTGTNSALLLNRCLDELRNLVTEKRLVNTAKLVADDINLWLNTEDENIEYDVMIFYPVTRSREIFARAHNES